MEIRDTNRELPLQNEQLEVTFGGVQTQFFGWVCVFVASFRVEWVLAVRAAKIFGNKGRIASRAARSDFWKITVPDKVVTENRFLV